MRDWTAENRSPGPPASSAEAKVKHRMHLCRPGGLFGRPTDVCHIDEARKTRGSSVFGPACDAFRWPNGVHAVRHGAPHTQGKAA